MSRKLLVFLVIVAAGVGAWWYFSRGPGSATGPSDLPAIRVDESRLTAEGKEAFAQLQRKVERLERADVKRKYDEGGLIVCTLEELGDQESSIEWALKCIDWFDKLSPEERQQTREGITDRSVAAALYHLHASGCYFVLGDREKGIEVLVEYLKEFPPDSGGRFVIEPEYMEAVKDLDRYYEKCMRGFGPKPKYVKSAP
jgi:hypothetical protein